MARISGRHLAHATNASILAATLALPAGLTMTAAEFQSANGGPAGVTQTTDPPPSPSSTPSVPPQDQTPPSPGDPSADQSPPPSPTDPGPSRTSPSSTPSGTSETSGTSDPAETGGSTSEAPPEQKADINEATATLNEEKERVPQELASTVETLIALIDAVEDPEELPQNRQGVTASANNLSTALAAIGDSETPAQLRRQLTSIVKQVTSAIKTVSDPRVPAEERSLLILVVTRTTSTMSMICDPQTPRNLRNLMISIMRNATYTVERTQGVRAGSADVSQNTSDGRDEPKTVAAKTQVPVSASSDIMHDRRTPPRERERLAEITQQVSALLRKISDPGTSQEERSEAVKELNEKLSRMKEQQERSASAQERPEQSLGKAAAFCTSAVFEATPESALTRGLERLIPSQWEAEGVKDFWKAEEKSNDTLDVIAQLGNNEHTHGPFQVVPLITELAELVPQDRLFGSLGAAALSCKQTATYLDEQFGVTVGSWLT